MTLSEEENRLFYRLYPSLMLYVNNHLQLYPHFTNINQWTKIDIEERLNIRDAYCNRTTLIDEFMQANPDNFNNEELELVKNWKNFVKGDFLLLRHLKKYTVFLDMKEDVRAYGVVALVDPFEYWYPHPPVYLKALLLSFKGKIIYDGLLNFYRVTFGGNMKKSFSETYQKAKPHYGII